jgi:hypothetical protein
LPVISTLHASAAAAGVQRSNNAGLASKIRAAVVFRIGFIIIISS